MKIKMRAHEIKHLNKISSFIHAISNRMTEDIKTILNGDYGLYEMYDKKHIKYYDFSVLNTFKINFLPISAEQVPLGFKTTLDEYPNGFINDKKLYLDESVYQFDDADLALIDEFYMQVYKRIIEWFNQCWIEAGGLDQKDHYRISMQYENTFFDLTHQKWVDE